MHYEGDENKRRANLVRHQIDFADAIDFGEVTKFDEQKRIIVVKADPSKMPQPLPPPVKDPNHPDFYRQNVADLSCFDYRRRRDAAKRLKDAPVDEQWRDDVAKVLVTCLAKREQWTQLWAIQALAVWGTSDSVLPLIELLGEQDDTPIRYAVMESLGELRDERAAPALARYLESERGLESLKAGDALIAMGSAAEATVVQVLDSPSARARSEAFRILEEVGTTKSLGALNRWANDGSSREDPRARMQIGLGGSRLHLSFNKKSLGCKAIRLLNQFEHCSTGSGQGNKLKRFEKQ